MNILCVSNKLPLQRGFFKNSTGDVLLSLRLLSKLYNFCNIVIIFSLMYVTMICRRATYFIDSKNDQILPKNVRLK